MSSQTRTDYPRGSSSLTNKGRGIFVDELKEVEYEEDAALQIWVDPALTNRVRLIKHIVVG
jgi:hypothetical protein